MSYRKKHIKNKIHKIKPKKPVLKTPIFWIFILFLIAVFTALYFVLFYSGFQVENIIISGNEKIQSKDIEKIVFDNINKKITKSIFLTNPPELQQLILKSFPLIETVIAERRLPQAVTIKIRERKPFAVFCPSTASGQASDQRFLIDKNGVIFGELQNLPQDMLIIKQALNNKEVFTGENVIEKNIMDMISKVETSLRDNFQVDIAEALVSDPARLDIKTSENWQIYFNLNSNTDLQIIKLNSLLRDEISATSRASLQYIDLRFGDRAYYK